MPHGVYVKLDKCDQEFLPPMVCQEHKKVGFCRNCSACRAFVGWVLVQPISRKWTFSDTVTGLTLQVQRTQLPLMPEAACPLYLLQGATCDPVLIAHFIMPRRADDDIKWLIVYVMLSRPRSLATIKSVNLTQKIHDIIEQGPPDDLVANFEQIKETRTLAREAARAHGLLPDVF